MIFMVYLIFNILQLIYEMQDIPIYYLFRLSLLVDMIQSQIMWREPCAMSREDIFCSLLILNFLKCF